LANHSYHRAAAAREVISIFVALFLGAAVGVLAMAILAVGAYDRGYQAAERDSWKRLP